MNATDLETQFHKAIIRGMLEDIHLRDVEGECKQCRGYDEIVKGEPWTYLDERTGLCEACYMQSVREVEQQCPYCSNGCSDCLL